MLIMVWCGDTDVSWWHVCMLVMLMLGMMMDAGGDVGCLLWWCTTIVMVHVWYVVWL